MNRRYFLKALAGTLALLVEGCSGSKQADDDSVQDAQATLQWFGTMQSKPAATQTPPQVNSSEFKLPYIIDFSTLPNGPLPSALTGATWAIVNGAAKNTPALLDENMPDPGLEADYSAGKCINLNKSGNPTLVDSISDLHGGSHAQQFTGTAPNNYIYPRQIPGEVGWRQFSGYAKRTAGSSGDVRLGLGQPNSLPGGGQYVSITSADWMQHKVSLISTDTSKIFRRLAYTLASKNWDTVIVDDFSDRLIDYPSLFAVLPSTLADVVVKIQPSALAPGDGTHIGILLRSDANQTNCIYVLFSQRAGLPKQCNISAVKKVGSTYTSILAETVAVIAPDAWLEARVNGDKVQVLYNGSQQGKDLTISDAELLQNTIHGILSAGDNSIKGFSIAPFAEPLTLIWAGSSWTTGKYYSPKVQDWLLQNTNYLQYNFEFKNAARSGNNIWSNLVRLSTEVLAYDPSVLIIDHANGLMADSTLEALIRRVLTHNPTTKIILIEAPTWNGLDFHDDKNVNNPRNKAAMSVVNAVAAHYAIPIVPVWEWTKSVVPGKYRLDALFLDGVHPGGEPMYSYIAQQLEGFLAQGFTRPSAALPDRLIDSKDYENEPIIKKGTGYQGKTGTWSETESRVESSEVGATITYTATCQSFGAFRADRGSNKVEISIDGGEFAPSVLYQNGKEISAGRGEHKITIRIPAGGSCRIDEFWAV